MPSISKKSKETTSYLSGIHQELAFRKAAAAAVPTNVGTDFTEFGADFTG
jgi:hypothetical protein